jgi:hypothetical protein
MAELELDGDDSEDADIMAGIIEVSKGSMPTIHNTREGDMSPEELGQCLLDIKVF